MPQEEVAGRQHGQLAPQQSPDVSPAGQDGGVWTPGHGRPTRESQEALWADIRDAAAGLAGVAGLHGHDDADLQQGTAQVGADEALAAQRGCHLAPVRLGGIGDAQWAGTAISHGEANAGTAREHGVEVVGRGTARDAVDSICSRRTAFG